jgi:hypothetical protein
MALVSCVCDHFSFVIFFSRRNGIQSLNVLDYIINALTQQFNCMVMLPSIFLILVADLILSDLNNGYAGLILTRARSRLSLLLAKICVLFVCAFLFTMICTVIYLISGLLSGLPLDFTWSSHSLFTEETSPSFVLIMIECLYIFGLTAYGTFLLMVSLILRNTVFTWGTGAFMNILSYVAWLKMREIEKWFPTSQMMFLSQYPNKLIVNTPGFTTHWSLTYHFLLFTFSVLLGLLLFRRINLRSI